VYEEFHSFHLSHFDGGVLVGMNTQYFHTKNAVGTIDA